MPSARVRLQRGDAMRTLAEGRFLHEKAHDQVRVVGEVVEVPRVDEHVALEEGEGPLVAGPDARHAEDGGPPAVPGQERDLRALARHLPERGKVCGDACPRGRHEGAAYVAA